METLLRVLDVVGAISLCGYLGEASVQWIRPNKDEGARGMDSRLFWGARTTVLLYVLFRFVFFMGSRG